MQNHKLAVIKGGFLGIYSETVRPRTVKLGTRYPLGWVKKPVDFHVTILDFIVVEVKKIMDNLQAWCFQTFSPKQSYQPQTWYMSSCRVTEACWFSDNHLRFQGHSSHNDHWSFLSISFKSGKFWKKSGKSGTVIQIIEKLTHQCTLIYSHIR